MPYLESSLGKLIKELDNSNFTFAFPRNGPFNESNNEVCKCVNIKLLDLLACFHYTLNTPRITAYR